MSNYQYYRGRPTRVEAKDPDATVVYGFDWEPYLDGNTILTSDWMTTGTLVVEGSSSADGVTSSVLLSGGESGQSYEVTNRITFSGANGVESDDRTMIVPVRDL